jgi:hypothetical protein
MFISVENDFWRFRQKLDDLSKRQIPFAAAGALNDTAKLIKAEITRALPSIFDRPTPFTMRAIGIKAARKNNLQATVFVKDRQAAYLHLEETGGTRAPEPHRPVDIPVDLQRDRYGGIGQGTLRRLRGRKDVFFAEIKGVRGFWQRGPMHSLRLLVAVKPRATYHPRFGFHPKARTLAQQGFARFLPTRLAEALRTAKP